MATLDTTIKQFIGTGTENADFRAKVQLLHDFFGTTCGFTQAADAGQINPATVNFPGSNNTNAGQEVWYFNDALQATRPAAFRIQYGRGADANSWRIEITVSMSVTNGSLTFLGVESQTRAASLSNTGTRTQADTTAYRVSGSGSGNRAVISLFHDVLTTPRGSVFSIERTKNSDGSDNGAGVVATINQTASSNSTVRFLNVWFSAPNQALWQSSTNVHGMISYVAASNSAGPTARAEGDTGSTLLGGKKYAFPQFPAIMGQKYPLMNYIYVLSGDWPVDFSNLAVPFYGSDRTYKSLGPGQSISNSGNTGWNLLMRFE